MTRRMPRLKPFVALAINVSILTGFIGLRERERERERETRLRSVTRRV